MITKFEDLFQYIGGFGLYQWVVFAVVCYVNMLYVLCVYGQIFMSLTPPHWCKADTSLEQIHLMGFNITEEELRSLTIPQLPNGLRQSCLRYNISIVEVLNEGQHIPGDNWTIVGCNNGWNYNFSSVYYPTLTSELNLVCNDDWKPPLAQSLFFIGGIFGGPLFGWLADNFGRLPAAIGSNVLSGVAGLWTAFSNGYVSFCVSRFLLGVATDTNHMIIFILGLELVAPKYRTMVANIPITIFLSGSLIILPWLAIGIGHWRTLAIVLAVPHLVLLSLPLYFPESIRWLIDKGKYERATRTIEKIAKINGKKLTDDFYSNYEMFYKKSQEDKQKIVNWWDLLKTPNLRRRFLLLCFMWVAIIVSYDGDVRNIETLGGNFFISFSLIGVMEAPADILNMFSVEKLGRRYTAVLSLLFSALSSFVVALIPREDNWYSLMAFALMGRFFITIAANCGLQYVVEVLPTVARAQGTGVSHTLGCGMTLITPYIVYMSKFYTWAPYTIIGFISLSGSIASLFLPETKGQNLPGSLEDGEEAFKDQKIFYNPFNEQFQDTTERKTAGLPADTKL